MEKAEKESLRNVLVESLLYQYIKEGEAYEKWIEEEWVKKQGYDRNSAEPFHFNLSTLIITI